MSMDPSGARLVTGSYDYDLKIWDFGGMKSDFKPFRSFESRAGHQVSFTHNPSSLFCREINADAERWEG